MFYQKALAKFKFLSRVNSRCLQAEIDTGEVATMFEEVESTNSLLFAMPFHVGAYFCMGAYKHNVVVVIQMGCLYSWGAYFVWVLIIPILQ